MRPSFISNVTDISGIKTAGGDGPGIAVDGSVALDIGYFWRSTDAKNFSLSVGVDVLSATNTLEISGYKEISTAFTFYTSGSISAPTKISV